MSQQRALEARLDAAAAGGSTQGSAGDATVLLCTAPSRKVGQTIAERLLSHKLVACVNMIDKVSSVYTWEGKVTRDDEVLMVMKARAGADTFEAIRAAVAALHPHSVFELLALPVARGNAKYLGWIADVTALPYTPDSPLTHLSSGV